MKVFSTLLLVLLPVFICSADIVFDSETGGYTAEVIVDGLSSPWSAAFLPDNEGILITEKTGRLLRFGSSGLEEISGLPEISVTGQGGLLDVITDVNFKDNRLIYFSFSRAGRGGFGTAVARAELKGLELKDMKIIFEVSPKSPGGLHFGSRLVMTEDRSLYISLGERGAMMNAQNLLHHGGSVVRINSDGSVPSDNPFSRRSDAYPEIFSYGHRNPQGMAVHPETGEIWLHEHGPKGGDEVNILKKGANYGWPLVTYGINYNGSDISDRTSAPGIEEPVVYWVPSIAPSGMAFYRGDLFVGALAGKHLRRLVLEGDRVIHQEVLLQDTPGRIRDVRTGPDGSLYFLTDGSSGTLYRLSPR